jgi:3-phosphoshikimate 1-carboxyvinyltransferase
VVPLSHRPAVEIGLPGGKEDTNRALISGALSDATVRLHNVSRADDSLVLMEALSALGVPVQLNGYQCRVGGIGRDFRSCSSKVFSGESGTASRFLTGLCALVPGEFVLDCGSRMRERPMADLLASVAALGGRIRCLGSEAHLPVLFGNVPAPAVRGGRIAMSGMTSSQFFSALLLIGARLQGGIEIEVQGDQVSRSYIDMTQSSLRRFGVTMLNDGYRRYRVPETRRFECGVYDVECDASAATYFLALAAITGGTIRVRDLSVNSAQGDARFCNILRGMGCRVSHNASQRWIEVQGPRRLQCCRVDMLSTPDSAQTLAVVAAFAVGRSRITGLRTLRIKETDRLHALEQELSRMGISVRTGADWIEIEGGRPHGAVINTYEDHRMVMSFAIAGAVVEGLHIAGAAAVSKSFPEFWTTLEQAGAKSQAEGVVSDLLTVQRSRGNPGTSGLAAVIRDCDDEG